MRRWRWYLGLRGPAGEQGQTMVEYALVLALIAIVVLLAVSELGDALVSVFERIRDEVEGV